MKTTRSNRADETRLLLRSYIRAIVGFTVSVLLDFGISSPDYT